MKQLIVIDFINEIVHREGKLSGKGYVTFCEENNTLENIKEARKHFDKIFYVALAFKKDYGDLPKNSLLLGKAQEFNILQEGTWSTKIVEELQPINRVYHKNRMNPFVNKELENELQGEIYLAGVATDLVVQSAARHLHDKDHKVFVLSDCCAAASKEDHKQALDNMSKFCHVITSKEIKTT